MDFFSDTSVDIPEKDLARSLSLSYIVYQRIQLLMAVEDDICEVVVHLDGNLNARLLAVAEQLGESQDAVIELAISRELPHLEATVAPNKGVSSYQCEQHHSGVDRVTRSAPTNS